MDLNHLIVERLAFIKFLYQHGVELSNKPSPYNSASILMFHDSIDLFLQLAAEKLNVQIKKEKTFFWNYLNLINQQLSNNNKKLYHMNSMIRLNGARNSLKHQGRGSIKSDIESFRVTTKEFFIDNAPLIFGIEFSDISMIDMIENDKVKKILKDVRQFSKNGQFKEALERSGIAFNKLISSYEKNRKSYGVSVFDFGIKDFGFDDELGDYGKDFEKINEKLENIHFALKLLCFNIDYRKYAKFLHLTPHLYRGKEIYGKYIAYWDFTKETDFTEEKVEFCINFIIESALKLQEFDFKIK